MATVEEEINALLSGEIPGDVAADFKTGNNVLEFRPIAGKTVCYLISAVIISDRGDVLLTQSTSHASRGKWYVPSGRVEPGETLQEAVVREVRTQTRMECTPETLIAVEVLKRGEWFRFSFTARLTTTDQWSCGNSGHGGRWWTYQDVQAAGKKLHKELILRGRDVVPVINLSFAYQNQQQFDRCPPVLPSPKPHSSICIKLLIVNQHLSGDYTQVLVCYQGAPHVPCVGYAPHEEKFNHVIKSLFIDALGSAEVPFKMEGLLALEHCGKPVRANDGMCIVCLVSVRTRSKDDYKSKSSRYRWIDVDGELGHKLSQRVHKRQAVTMLSF